MMFSTSVDTAPHFGGDLPGIHDEFLKLKTRELVTAIELRLRPLSDPERAVSMSAYLLNQFTFLGLQAPLRRGAVKDLVHVRVECANELILVVQALWRLPEREFRYVAIDMLRYHCRLLTPEYLPALQALLLCEPWWETVDGLSAVISKILFTACHTDKDALAVTDNWTAHASLWVRRSAVLHQLGWRLDTDKSRLAARALTLGHEQEFFIRKAIGWALRDYARWNPEWVSAFSAEHTDQLSELTRREAARHMCNGNVTRHKA